MKLFINIYLFDKAMASAEAAVLGFLLVQVIIYTPSTQVCDIVTA
jgi:hypothetical protein